jgi:hypothetical protein
MARHQTSRGARKLTGDNLKLVWANYKLAHFEDVYETQVCRCTPTSVVVNSAKVSSC